MASEKMWGGRFSQETDALVEQFNASIDVDSRMYAEDIQGSIAHVCMLAEVGVLSEEERDRIIQGLEEIRHEIEAGKMDFRVDLEDVHMNIEARLIEKIGDVGRKLHTARSRNDQVATDLRLYLRRRIHALERELRRLQGVLVDMAEQHADSVMPGFTHLQVAQPVTLGHHLLAYVEMIERDVGRFQDARRRMNECPLGAAALAGTTFPIDRSMTAKALGFSGPSRNSLDAVSDRDFVLEITAAAAICMVHLSRMCEEWVLWSSAQFAFLELPDAYCTGSSIMPQKKNPDMPELIRGKTGRVIAGFVSLATMMKALPLAYNKDMQEDKHQVFEAIDQLEGCVRILAGMLPGIRFDEERLLQAAESGFSTATDLADDLVRAGVPFREAHAIVGRAVARCIQEGKRLHELTREDCAAIDTRLKPEMLARLDVRRAVALRDHFGGTAPKQVRRQVAWWRKRLEGACVG